jgi:hypothetical protein
MEKNKQRVGCNARRVICINLKFRHFVVTA